MRVQVVIAVRGGTAAKSRCGEVLRPADQARLVEAMLGDMLDAVLAVVPAGAVHVATPTAALAEIARARGAGVIAEARPAGLNAAFDHARQTIAADAPEAPVILLPGDLPALDSEELAGLIAACCPGRIVLSPAGADGGTGALALPAGTTFSLAFGSESFARHLAAAHAAGLEICIQKAPSLAFDVDRPTDLETALRLIPESRTAALLSKLSLCAEVAA